MMISYCNKKEEWIRSLLFFCYPFYILHSREQLLLRL